MSHKLQSFIIIFVILLSATGVFGDVRNVITLDECTAIVLSSDISVRLEYNKLLEAQSQYDQKRAESITPIRAQMNFVKSNGPASDVLDYNEAKLSILQPIYTGGCTKSTLKYYDLNLRLTELKYKKAQLNSVFEAKKAFYEVLQAQKVKETINESIETLEEYLKQIQRRYNTKTAIKLELLRAEAELLKANQELGEINAELQLAKAKLNVLLSRDIMADTEVTDIPDQDLINVEKLDAFMHKVFEVSLEARKSELETSMDELQVFIINGRQLPQVSFGANYGYSGKEVSSVDTDWQAKLTVDVPVFDWGTTRNINKLSHLYRDSKRMVIGEEQKKYMLSVLEVYTKVKTSINKISSVDVFINKAKENQRIAETLYKEEGYATEDLLKAQSLYKDTMVSYQRDKYNYCIYCAKLEELTGGRP
jgi:outer membrane protein